MKNILFFVFIVFVSCENRIEVNGDNLALIEKVNYDRRLDSLQNELKNAILIDSFDFCKETIIKITNNNSGNCPPDNIIIGYSILSERFGKDKVVEKRLMSCLSD